MAAAATIANTCSAVCWAPSVNEHVKPSPQPYEVGLFFLLYDEDPKHREAKKPVGGHTG